MRTIPRYSRGVFFAVVFWTVAFATCASEAQSDEASDAEYQQVVANAVQEFGLGNWEEARSLFRKAHELRPSARTLRGLGMASFEARRYVEAILALRESLADSRDPLTAEQRSRVEALLERARQYVGHFEVVVEPGSATITVDGREAVFLDGKLVLEPGRRELVARAEGYETLTRQVMVDGGQSGDIELVLSSEKPTVAVPRPADESGKEKETAYVAAGADEADGGPGALPWVVLAASGAIAAGGGVLFALGMNDVSTVEDAGDGTRWEQIKDASDRAPAFTTAGGIMLGVGLAGVAVGVVLLTTGGSEEAEATSVVLTPRGIELRGAL